MIALFALLAIAAECSGADDVRARIIEAIGEVPRDFEIDIRAERSKTEGWTVFVSVKSPRGHGTRELEARTCELAVRSAALIVALAIDEQQPAAATTTTATASRSVFRAKDEPAGACGAESAFRLYAHAAVEMTTGVLPGVDNGVALSFGAELEPISITAGVAYHFSERVLAAGFPGVGGDFDLIAAHLRFCVSTTFELEALRAGVCARAEAGVLRGRGFGVSDALREERPWAAVGVGPEVAVAIDEHVAIAFGLEGLVALWREQFVIVNAGPLHTPSKVCGHAHLGVQLFW